MAVFFKVIGWLLLIAYIVVMIIYAYLMNDYTMLFWFIGFFVLGFILEMAKKLNLILAETIKMNQMLEKLIECNKPHDIDNS
jgi:hypothetical protein